MNEHQAFVIADHMIQVNRILFQPNMSWKEYVKQRSAIMRNLLK